MAGQATKGAESVSRMPSRNFHGRFHLYSLALSTPEKTVIHGSAQMSTLSVPAAINQGKREPLLDDDGPPLSRGEEGRTSRGPYRYFVGKNQIIRKLLWREISSQNVARIEKRIKLRQ